MGYDLPDVYYNPENFGLLMLSMLEESGLSWEFNMFGVWRDADSNLYYGVDSGCSCPSPFEDFTSVDSLTRATKRGIMNAARSWGATASQQADLYEILDDLSGSWT